MYAWILKAVVHRQVVLCFIFLSQYFIGAFINKSRDLETHNDSLISSSLLILDFTL